MSIEVPRPLTSGFTIYSKSGCPNCTKVKKRIQSHFLVHKEVDCDDFLIEDKEGFLSHMEIQIGRICTTFPMVFYDGKFIGGYSETDKFVDELMLSFAFDF